MKIDVASFHPLLRYEMMVREQERFFRNAKTWKQISTNVPPEMLSALKKQLKDEYTMSHLLRDLISESEVMRDRLPQPIWSRELTKNIAALQEELTALREELTEMRQNALKPTESVNTDQIQTLQFAPDFEPLEGEEPSINQTEEKLPTPELANTRQSMSLFGRITEMLGVARRTA